MRPLLLFAVVLFVLLLGAVVLDDSPLLLIYASAPLLLGCGALLIWSFVVAFTLIRRRLLLPALICLVLPFALPFTAYESIPYAQWPVDYVRFKTKQSSYDAQVAQLPKDGKRFAEFIWSASYKGVVYDETDEVALPYGHQSTAWKKRFYDTELTCRRDGPGGRVEPMGGHYYAVAFAC